MWNIPALSVARNGSRPVELRSYVTDTESRPDQLVFQNLNNQNPLCTVSLSGHVLTFTPSANWMGTCTATVDAYDALHPTTGTFQVTVVLMMYNYLPFIRK